MGDGPGVLGLDQPLLGVEQALQVRLAFDILQPGEPRRDPGFLDDLEQERFAGARRARPPRGRSPPRPARSAGRPVELDAFHLSAAANSRSPRQPAAVEDRREQACAEREVASERSGQARRLAERARAEA